MHRRLARCRTRSKALRSSRLLHLLMDCAFEGNETRQLALDLGLIPVAPPHPNRIEP
jgi:hypothetical protein